MLAVLLIRYLGNYLEQNDLGILLGADGQLWILPDKMRIPDISFIRWDRLPGRKLPQDRVFRVAPDLAMEIISAGNTKQEMALKLAEYFQAGTKLVWYIDARARSANIYTSPEETTTIQEDGYLLGGDVLPGFEVRLGEIFERASRGS